MTDEIKDLMEGRINEKNSNEWEHKRLNKNIK